MPYPQYDIVTETAIPGTERLAARKLKAELNATSIGGYASCILTTVNGAKKLILRWDPAVTLSAVNKTTIDAVILAHTGTPDIQVETIMYSVNVAPTELVLVIGNFESMAGVMLNPLDYVKNLANARLRVRGCMRADGGGAQLRVVADNGLNATVLTMPYPITDSSGSFQFDKTFDSIVSLPVGRREYRLEGHLGSATSAAVRALCFDIFTT